LEAKLLTLKPAIYGRMVFEKVLMSPSEITFLMVKPERSTDYRGYPGQTL